MRQLLFQFLLYLLPVVLQIHDGFLGHFQVSFQLPLHSLQVGPQLLLLLQAALELGQKGEAEALLGECACPLGSTPGHPGIPGCDCGLGDDDDDISSWFTNTVC